MSDNLKEERGACPITLKIKGGKKLKGQRGGGAAGRGEGILVILLHPNNYDFLRPISI